MKENLKMPPDPPAGEVEDAREALSKLAFAVGMARCHLDPDHEDLSVEERALWSEKLRQGVKDVRAALARYRTFDDAVERLLRVIPGPSTVPLKEAISDVLDARSALALPAEEER